MTIADTPALAMADIIDDPVNPFSGAPINNDDRSNAQSVILTHDFEPDKSKTLFYQPQAVWYKVQHNAYDKNCRATYSP